MRKATLYRIQTGDDGTFGLFVAHDSSFGCFVVELPWRNNEKMISCVPDCDIVFALVNSPKHGWCYEAQKVPGNRTHIQFHSANWAGDKALGYKSQLLGCFAPGSDMVKISGQLGVTSSVKTVSRLLIAMNQDPFKLKIRWAKRGLPL